METHTMRRPGQWLLRAKDGAEFLMNTIYVVDVPEGVPIEEGQLVERYPVVDGHDIRETGNPGEYLVTGDDGTVLARQVRPIPFQHPSC